MINTDKIKCNGIDHNWKVFFRVSQNNIISLKSYTMRISSPLIAPVFTEDNVEFNQHNKIKGFAYDFSYYLYKTYSKNKTISE